MVAEPPRSQRRLLPEIRVQLGIAGRHARFTLPPAAQIGGIVVVLAGWAAVAWLAADWISYNRLAAGQRAALVRAEATNADLQDRVAALRDRLVLSREAREAAHRRLAALTGQAKSLNDALAAARAKIAVLKAAQEQQNAASQEAASSKAGSIGEATVALDHAEQQLNQIEAARSALAARLDKVEAERRAMDARAAEYDASIAAAQKEMHRLGAGPAGRGHKER